MIANFRTYDLAIGFYRVAISSSFPVYLRDQLHRAASSIVLNLAEGNGRTTRAERRRFFSIAFGSLREAQAILDLSETPVDDAKEFADKLAAHLYLLVARTSERRERRECGTVGKRESRR